MAAQYGNAMPSARAPANAMIALNGPSPLPGQFVYSGMRSDPRPGDYDSLTSLERQLEGLKDKAKPGETIRLFDKDGNEYHYLRNDDYEFGYAIAPHDLAPFNPR